MVFWRTTQLTSAVAAATTAGLDHNEEMPAEVDEPPDEPTSTAVWSPPKLTEDFIKSTHNPPYSRRESLLTRQLHHFETDHSDEDPAHRALSTQSTWSTTSTADLTSDDGRSVPSPATSPPLPPTQAYNAPPLHDKLLEPKVKIAGQEDVAAETFSDKSVEAVLGRKRCIMFACRGKEETRPLTTPQPETSTSSPPKRKCMIKFDCPTRTASDLRASQAKRNASPAPVRRNSSQRSEITKMHRGSDSTVTHGSPKSVRRSPSSSRPVQIQSPAAPPVPSLPPSDSDDSGAEATRFHEFASSDDEPEEWVRESTCHRSRLTITDTLKKENVIRKACEEVEEEALEEEAEQEDEDEIEQAVEDEDDDDEIGDEDADEAEADEADESDHTDAGFHSDDEHGFAASDSEDEGSDYEWWKPGGSTAATSVEHLDRATPKPDQRLLASSINSLSSGQTSSRRSRRRHRMHPRSQAIPIRRPSSEVEVDNVELPDSTDFVCGTLDEDRPLEQAYINRMKEKEAVRHKARPQDIDPTFPTSDPEMDEEDDEDLEDPEESHEESMMHGEMDELNEQPLRYVRGRSGANRSPPPPKHYSPPPKVLRKLHSPPPPLVKRTTARSPPPPTVKRNPIRSPPPRKLFGQSPRRARAPVPANNRITSPPNTRNSSPARPLTFAKPSGALGERPQPTRTASLPRSGGYLAHKMGTSQDEHAEEQLLRRGAIDIVKGLEKKRLRRKEKMLQKYCAAKAAGRGGEKIYKVKPGKGCEKMREVGLELQRYRGKGEHIISY